MCLRWLTVIKTLRKRQHTLTLALKTLARLRHIRIFYYSSPSLTRASRSFAKTGSTSWTLLKVSKIMVTISKNVCFVKAKHLFSQLFRRGKTPIFQGLGGSKMGAKMEQILEANTDIGHF